MRTQVQILRETPTCWAFVHDLSNATKCDTWAPESQAACNIRK
jgi:hypothetical protein